MPTTGKTVIITGAARGIGAAMARKLASIGMNVIVNYASSPERADALVREIETAGGAAIAVRADVRSSQQFTAMFDAAETRFGGVDALVNNAGLMKNKPLGEIEEELFDQMFAINVRGVLNGLKLASNRMRDGGRIVNISTSVIAGSPPGYGTYCATKAAVEALTRSVSRELGARGIRANCVAPGPTDTELLTTANSDERLKTFASMTPLGRLGQVNDIANVVAFLMTDEAGWINGQSLRVNGGLFV